MASLVADYSSDSEDEFVQDDYLPAIKVKEEIKEEVKAEIKEEVKAEIKEEVKVEIKEEVKIEIKEEEESSALPSAPSLFFGITDEASDDEDDDNENTTTAIKVKKETTSISSRLPSLAEVNPGIIGSSVFVNRFDRAEQAKHKILEKHVKLTEAAPKKPANQPVCWKFKKGKCHMGKNCRFFHAVDNLSDSPDTHPGDKTNFDNSHRSPYHPAAYVDARRRPLEADPEDEDSYMSNLKKKKRVGINDRLVPPKKAFDSLMEMRKKERPWTMPGAPS